jgi:hypothetical protein
MATTAVFAPPAYEQPEVPETDTVEQRMGFDPIAELLKDDPEAALIGHEDEKDQPRKLSAEERAERRDELLLRAIQSLEGHVSAQERTKQKTILDILPDSPWNPTGRRDMPSPRNQIFQHGMPVNPMMMTAEEIILANKLKPGRYVNRTVEVTRSTDGSLNITWPNKRIDQRMEFNGKFPTFASLCNTIIAERAQKEEARRKGQFDAEEAL